MIGNEISAGLVERRNTQSGVALVATYVVKEFLDRPM